MLTSLVVIFIITYAAIALEHPLKINKSASALIGAGLLWTIYACATGNHTLVNQQLDESLVGYFSGVAVYLVQYRLLH